MKIKFSDKKFGGILLIVLMFGSSISYAFFYVFRGTGGNVELPKTNIIDYRLSNTVEYYLLQTGKTVMLFSYNDTCDTCQQYSAYLENLVLSPDYGNQIYLEKIATNKTSSLVIASAYGQKTVRTLDENDTFNTLCKLLTNPPASCVQINGLNRTGNLNASSGY